LWQRVLALEQQVHELQRAQQALFRQFGAPGSAAVARAEPDFMSHLLIHGEFLRSLTGAPSADELNELCDEFASATQHAWRFGSVDLRTGVVLALAHLRLAMPMRALAGLFHVNSSSTVCDVVHHVLDTLAQLAMEPDRRGAVHFLCDHEIVDSMSDHMYECMPTLRAMVDCTAVFVTRPVASIALTHELFDGEQHDDTWVKFFLCVAPHGYVMHVAGPFAPAGRAADGLILTREVARTESFRAFAQRPGAWLADCSFWGCVLPPGVAMR
jgi:hypothetical protein